MKKLLFVLVTLISCSSYSEIKLKINEPMRFEAINLSTMSDTVVGRASIEIYTDDLQNDYGKQLIFKFPEKGLMTNKRRWLKIEKYMMEDKDKVVVVENERRIVNIYAVIDRSTINDGKMEAKFIEGEYIGQIPVVVSQYTKITGKKEENALTKEAGK